MFLATFRDGSTVQKEREATVEWHQTKRRGSRLSYSALENSAIGDRLGICNWHTLVFHKPKTRCWHLSTSWNTPLRERFLCHWWATNPKHELLSDFNSRAYIILSYLKRGDIHHWELTKFVLWSVCSSCSPPALPLFWLCCWDLNHLLLVQRNSSSSVHRN